MKAEYDFSTGEQGKFYHTEAQLQFPIYLDPDISDQMGRLADDVGIDVETLVNEWLRTNLSLLASVKRTENG